MKRGFLSVLFVSLVIATPSIVQAEENEKPLVSLGLSEILNDSVQDLETQTVQSDTATEVQAASVPAISSSNQVNTDNQAQKEQSGLLSIGLGLPIVGEVKIDLLSGGKAESGSDNTTTSQNRLLGVEIKDSELLGNVNLEVLKANQQGENTSSSGLVSLDVDNALLGQTHVGVLEGNQSKSSDTANASAGLLVVQTKDSILGNARIGVGEYTKNNNQEQVKLASISNGLPSNPISGPDSDIVDQVKPTPPTVPGNNPSGSKNPPGLNNQNGGEEQSSVQNSNNANNGNNGNVEEGLQSASSEQSNTIRDNVLAIAQLTDAGNSTVLNQHMENKLDEFKKIINQANESETNTIKLVAPTASVAPGNSSVSSAGAGSGSAGAANFGGVTGLAAYMAVDYFHEMELANQLFNRSDKLSDQWRKSPPGDPPKATFFLIA
nr:hypothetical protein [uncultured Bacillus sp.]